MSVSSKKLFMKKYEKKEKSLHLLKILRSSNFFVG